ncbi:tyrosine-type recombinase/integrase, partial [Kibdelosporangium philippinense]
APPPAKPEDASTPHNFEEPVFQKCKDADPPCEGARCGHPWTVRYREPGGRTGKQREKTLPRKREADAFAVKVENDKNQGTYLDPERGKVTVKAWAEKWLDHQILADSSRKDYRAFFVNHVFPHMGSKSLAGTTTSDVQSLVTKLHRGYDDNKPLAAYTIKIRMVSVKSFFKAAVKDRRIPSNQCDDVTYPRMSSQAVDRDQIPTLAEVNAIAGAMPERYRLAVWLMAGLGLRISEALAVSIDCVRGSVLRVRQQTSVKGPGGSREPALAPLKHRSEGDYREIPLAAFLADEITAHVDERGTWTIEGQDGLLFAAPSGKLATRTTLRHYWLMAMKATGLDFTPHDLRHFFASTALAGGVALHEVSHWLGHRSIDMTVDIYGHLTEDAPERMRRVMQQALRPPAELAAAA